MKFGIIDVTSQFSSEFATSIANPLHESEI